MSVLVTMAMLQVAGFMACNGNHGNVTGGWVHGVSFSPSGNKLAWVGHDSSVSVVDAANGSQ
jgi:actin related protein 2/3 complex subunit 1A/1B